MNSQTLGKNQSAPCPFCGTQVGRDFAATHWGEETVECPHCLARIGLSVEIYPGHRWHCTKPLPPDLKSFIGCYGRSPLDDAELQRFLAAPPSWYTAP